MKIWHLLLALAFAYPFTVSTIQAENYVFTFDNSLPNEFLIGGNGDFSQSLNSSIVFSGANSLEINTSRGFGPNYAGTSLTFAQPIKQIEFSIYDQFAGSAPFYMYFGLGPALVAWQDSGLSDDVLIYGGSAVPTPRTVGWHTVQALISNNTITYNYNGSPLGTYTSAGPLSITNTGWTVDSAWGGNYSIYIDNITVQTEPELTPISWGSAQDITGDSDVSTLGSLLYAYNIGATGVSSTTVNGVAFSPYVFPGGGVSTTTTGSVTFTESPGILLSSNSLGDGSSPFSTLSANYQNLLSSGGSAGNPTTITGTFGGLTIGNDYLIQWWSNDSANTDGGAFTQTQASQSGGISTVTLDSNLSNSVGGLGQYAIGTFTATDSFVEFDLNGISGFPLINAFQVRDVTSAAVPEPGQVAASLLLLAGIGGYVWLKRRKAAKAATA